MQAVLNFLSSKGFAIPDFVPDGTLRRFGRNGSKDSAWYVAWQNARMSDGKFYYICSFGDWRTGEQHLYKPEKLTSAENVAIDAQIKQQQVKIQKEKEKVQLETADKAERRFNDTAKVGNTPYMLRKNIRELYGAGIYKDWLQIPMRDTAGITWSLQSIMPDGTKIFMKGGKKKECFHVIGEPLSDVTQIYVCEGFATGASIRQATGQTVVVAFDAGNLLDVVMALIRKYPKLLIMVCGDDDRGNPNNPGRAKAEKAASLANGIALFPRFPEGDLKSTDFNDLHCNHGLDQVKEQLEGRPPEQVTGFIPLGYDESNYFFYHIPSKDIVKANTFSPIQMYRLAPMEYWEARYPTKKGTDLNKASHDLIQDSTAIGPFDSTRIRGTGVWLDKKRVIVNTGHSLIVDKKEISLSSLDSRYIYIQTRNRMPAIHSEPLTAHEGEDIARIISRFHWKKQTDSFLLSGWLVIARIAGALPIRPHIWITGGKGTGKSTLMEQLIAPCLGSPKGKLHLIGATTEAGIRQALKASSLPIIYDEIESTGKMSRERIEAVIELLRNAWSTSQGKILKGSAGGSSVEFQLHFAALLSSIRVKLDNDADRSRFSVLELGEHGDNPEEWKNLHRLIMTITEETGERLFSRACGKVQEIIEAQKVISVHIARVTSQRFGQQIGMLLAGWWWLEHDYQISEIQAKSLADDFVADVIEETKEEMSDEEECLNRIFTWVITLRTDSGASTTMSVADIIKSNTWGSYLVHYGIRTLGDKFVIANKHNELEKLYSGTRWEGNWSRALRRISGAALTNTSFGSRKCVSRGVSLPNSLI